MRLVDLTPVCSIHMPGWAGHHCAEQLGLAIHRLRHAARRAAPVRSSDGGDH
jgi:hypothetical protein